MAKFALILACYSQPQMMAKQIETWDSYPEEIQKELQVIVVDDCGEVPFTCEEEKPYDLQIYRVTKNIPWNQMGARNLGMKRASAVLRLMLDPDMVVSKESMAVIWGRLRHFQPKHLYKPWLRHMPENSKPFDYGSPNLYIIRGDDWWKAGGYDENFAGAKGYSDVILHRVLKHMYKFHHCTDIPVDFYPVRMIPDANVSNLDRNVKRNYRMFIQIVNFAARNSWNAYSLGVKRHIRFPWERVR